MVTDEDFEISPERPLPGSLLDMEDNTSPLIAMAFAEDSPEVLDGNVQPVKEGSFHSHEDASVVSNCDASEDCEDEDSVTSILDMEDEFGHLGSRYSLAAKYLSLTSIREEYRVCGASAKDLRPF